MVKLTGLLAAAAALAGLNVLAAPTDDVPITVINNCKHDLRIYQGSNDEEYAPVSVHLEAKSSHDFKVNKYWGGRIWARLNCTSDSDCHPGAPASLAEFLMNGALGKDFYDVSFVDGYNLPISIAPHDGEEKGYECGVPACATLPDCPESLIKYDDKGEAVGCLSACNAFGDDEYCCTGEYRARGLCGTNVFAGAIKAVCPEVYTYAHDDSTSMYACQDTGYTVTFCPA